jgi:hypothetical protein
MAGAEGDLHWLDLEDGTCRTLRNRGNRLRSLSMGADGKSAVVSGAGEDGVVLLDEAGRELASLAGPAAVPHAAALTREGVRFLAAGKDGKARLYDADGRVLAEWGDEAEPVVAVGFSADGARILTATANGTVHLRDGAGRSLAACRGHGDAVHRVAFDADGTGFVSFGKDGTARRWDSAGRATAVLRRGGEEEGILAVSPDGSRSLCAGKSGPAILRDADGEELLALRGTASRVIEGAFLPDGRVVTVHQDGSIRTWIVDPAALLRTADARRVREFTPEERAAYADLLAPVPGSR